MPKGPRALAPPVMQDVETFVPFENFWLVKFRLELREEYIAFNPLVDQGEE